VMVPTVTSILSILVGKATIRPQMIVMVCIGSRIQ
jgi:hypothetical protein